MQRDGCSWDERLDERAARKLDDWVEGANEQHTRKLPRWIGTDRQEEQVRQLHIFCDASEVGYGAAAYVRVLAKQQVTSRLVLAKTRVAPAQRQTLPRMELVAA